MNCMRTYCFIVVFCVISNHVFAYINGGEVEDESEFNYSDESGKGPKYWGTLSPEWKACGTGKLQSPIDLSDQRVVILNDPKFLEISYKKAPAVIRNRGHDISLKWNGDAGGIVINGTAFNLVQCHWHTPSEHTLNGRRFRMEIHLVHENSQGENAVIGMTYRLGCPDKFLSQILGRMKAGVNNSSEDEIDAGLIDPQDIELERRSTSYYYTYIGSLTVPPCTEGVIWSVIKEVRTVSFEQIRALREAVHDGFEDNARPIQRLNGRTVYVFRHDNARIRLI